MTDAYAKPVHGWTCFHCGETFADPAGAQDHFGPSEHGEPACQIDAAEYRAMEERMRRYNEEDSDLHRAMYSMQSEHATTLRREEEKGYARGLKDAAKAVEFAEYMAKGAEHLLAAINVEDVAREVLGGDEAWKNEHADEDLTGAEQARAEFATGLRSDIYEFRKRAGLG